MVLRSGCIIPFQFRENKKLLMIGVPEENRNLNIWDLKNVVRAAFGVYNFEFRNKKIGFNIPDELLLNYLAQRHDLTNFVIEVEKVKDNSIGNENLCFEPSCSQKVNTPVSQNSNDSATNDNPEVYVIVNEAPLRENTSIEPPKKIRVSQAYRTHSPAVQTPTIDHIDILDNSDNIVHEIDLDIKEEITTQDYDQQNLNAVSTSKMPHKNLPNALERSSTQSAQQQHTRQQHLTRQSSVYKLKDGLTNEPSNSKSSLNSGILATRRYKVFKQLGEDHKSHNTRSYFKNASKMNKKIVKQKRHSPWNAEEEQFLLQLWEENLSQLRGLKRNAHVYAKIADVMCQNNFNFKAVEIRHKIKNLTNKYKDEKKSGKPSKWPYFEQIKMLMEKCKSINIKKVVEDSGANTSQSE